MQYKVTRAEALAFANEAFRNMDVELNSDDLADIAGALSSFAAHHIAAREEAAKGFRMIHDALADPSRPRQSCGEIAAHWLARLATGDTNVR